MPGETAQEHVQRVSLFVLSRALSPRTGKLPTSRDRDREPDSSLTHHSFNPLIYVVSSIDIDQRFYRSSHNYPHQLSDSGRTRVLSLSLEPTLVPCQAATLKRRLVGEWEMSSQKDPIAPWRRLEIGD